ncbi:Cell division coordinator CpoB [Fundidesulfovibrio magnetotacticus]|uniref:Cell division coordinator CpoB n=1 Tax=Fundidesulfovibrio magnetotacticus TaxID=2730080 RepID=A0A6V8M0Z6_9BACT|nr:tetratricopeptide repeat protein [Fundidesulfovibrio magnetotacticus]GFK95527.1 Cell division coordinator CpoB [Fundidesulfovibrio magnetotacticus]
MRRFGLIVLAMGLVAGGCAQKQPSRDAARLNNLESGFAKFQEQQRARDADMEFKLREIAARLDALAGGKAPGKKAVREAAPARHAQAPASGGRRIVAGQVIPYASLAGPDPAAAPAPIPALMPAPAAYEQRQPAPAEAPRGKRSKTREPQPVAAPAPLPAPAVQTQPTPPAVPAPPVPAVPAPPAPAVPAPAPGPQVSVEEQRLYTEALRAVSANRNDEARKRFNEFQAKFPSSAKNPEVLFWIGESYMGDKSYNQAILSFKDVSARFPGDPKAVEAVYRTAEAYERLGDKANAAFNLKLIVDEHPNSDVAGKARQKLKQLGQ